MAAETTTRKGEPVRAIYAVDYTRGELCVLAEGEEGLRLQVVSILEIVPGHDFLWDLYKCENTVTAEFADEDEDD